MQKVKLMTDSACDIPLGMETELNIHIIPFHIIISGKSYQERIDFTPEEFYEILKKESETPTTAQITAYEFIKAFEQIYQEGYEELIYVSINSNGSATNENACMAQTQFFDKHPKAADKFKIHIVDSKTYSCQYGYAVMEGAKRAKKGESAKNIIKFINHWLINSRIYCTAYSLDFAKKSGRVSSVAAFVGEILGIRPIITFEDCVSKVVGKIRGDKNIMPELIKKAVSGRVPNTPYMIGGSSFYKERRKEFADMCKEAFGSEPVYSFDLGAAVSINLGPESIGILVLEAHER